MPTSKNTNILVGKAVSVNWAAFALDTISLIDAFTAVKGSTSFVVRPESVAGALTLGNASYAIGGNTAYYVDSINGDDALGAGTVGDPVQTIKRAEAMRTSGSWIVLRGSASSTAPQLYPEGVIGNPSATYGGIALTKGGVIQNYPGESVAVDGSVIVTGWTSDGAGHWSAPFVRAFNRGPTESSDALDQNTVGWQYVNASFPTAPWPERVFINGVEQQQVTTLAACTAGKFFVAGTASGTNNFTFTSSRYYVGSDPTGKEMRCVQYATTISLLAANMTMRGFAIQRFGPTVAHQGTVKSNSAGCVFENMIFTQHSTCPLGVLSGANIAIKNCTIDGNGWMGIHGTKTNNLLIYRTRVKNSNLQSFNQAPAAGGIKITLCHQPRVDQCVVTTSNASSGIWFDESVWNPMVLTTDVGNNEHHGIITELNGQSIVANCYFYGNGTISLYNMDGNSPRMWNNTIVGGTSGLNNNGDTRAPMNASSVGLDSRYSLASQQALPMTWVTGDVENCNNVIQNGSAPMFVLRTSTARTTASYGTVTLDGNFYNCTAASYGSAFQYVNLGSFGTLAAFTAATGKDVNSDSIFGSNSLNADGSVKATVLATIGTAPRPLPADIAALIGRAAGETNIGSWR